MVHIVGVRAPKVMAEGDMVKAIVSIYNPEYPDHRRDMEVWLQTEGLSTGNKGSVVKVYSSPWPGEDVPITHPMWSEDIVDHITLWDRRGFVADTASVIVRLPTAPAVSIPQTIDRDKTVTLRYRKIT